MNFFTTRPSRFFPYLSCHLFSFWHLFLWPFLNCYVSDYLFFFPIPVYILTIVHYWRILNYHSSVDKLLNLEFRSITFTYVCFKIFTMLSHVNILQVPQSQISKFNLSYPHPIPVSFFVISISVMAPLIIELPGQKLRHVLRSLP